jgi:hypothetical protein
MEFVARLLAAQLGAQTVFRADNSYDLGGLLPSAFSRLSDLLGKAVDSAQSWGNEDQKSKAQARRQRLKEANTHKGEEDWTVNKAVHFNEWANFSPNDFMPIVNAFKDLLACAQCDDCGSWLYITPKGTSPEGLRCSCNSVNLNLKKKPK